MKLKYALYEQKRNKLIAALIFVQTAIVLVLLVSILSAIFTRYEKYKPLEHFFQGEGVNMHVNYISGRDGQRYLPFIEASDLENYLRKAHVVSSYNVQISFDIDGTKAITGTWTPTIAYDDELLTAYTPKLEAGRWLKPEDADTDAIEIVLAQIKDKYKVGDTILLTAHNGVEGEEKLPVPIQAKVVGILADGATPLMREYNPGEYEDFRDYYFPFNKSHAQRSIVFVSKRDIRHNNEVYTKQEKKLSEDWDELWPYIMEGTCFIRYEEGISEEDIEYNAHYLTLNGDFYFRRTSAEMRENSRKYIMNQMNMLIPVLIGLVVLTFMSIVSNTVIMIQQNMRTYAIYYMLGMTWRECIAIHSRYVILSQMGTFLFTMVCIAICRKTGVLKKTVFSLGKWQILGCLAMVLLFILFSIVLSYVLIGKRSAKDIMREAGK